MSKTTERIIRIFKFALVIFIFELIIPLIFDDQNEIIITKMIIIRTLIFTITFFFINSNIPKINSWRKK